MDIEAIAIDSLSREISFNGYLNQKRNHKLRMKG